MPDIDVLLSAFVTLFVTIDPPGLAPIFVGLTNGMEAAQRRKVALNSTLIATGVLAFFALFGRPVLDLLGITLPAFRVAGGLLLFWIAFEMVFEKRVDRKSDTATKIIDHDHPREIAAFPMAVPLIAGPGAITAVILLAGGNQSDWSAKLIVMALVIAVMLITLASLVAGVWIDRYLSSSARSIATRLLGVLLAALAVQFVADGIGALVSA